MKSSINPQTQPALSYLWVGELESGDGEEDFSEGDDDVLRELPHDVHGLGLHVQVVHHLKLKHKIQLIVNKYY